MSETVKNLVYSIQFGNLSNAELDQVSAAVRFRRNVLAQNVKSQLQRGASVQFFSTRYGKNLQGVVEKVAIKYITVSTTQGRWKVPANLLEVV